VIEGGREGGRKDARKGGRLDLHAFEENRQDLLESPAARQDVVRAAAAARRLLVKLLVKLARLGERHLLGAREHRLHTRRGVQVHRLSE